MTKRSVTQDEPPSYAAAVETGGPPSRVPFESISNRIAGVRTQNLISVVENKIIPILRRRAEQGLSRSSIALIPADTKEAIKSGKIIGLPIGCDDAEQVQLEGELNKKEFWCQTEVVSELQTLIEANLASFSDLIASRKEKTSSDTASQTVMFSTQTKVPESSLRSRGMGGLFSRRQSSLNKRETIAAPSITEPEPKKSDPIQVKAFQDEFCLRTISDFGLYETVTKAVVMVQVKVT